MSEYSQENTCCALGSQRHLLRADSGNLVTINCFSHITQDYLNRFCYYTVGKKEIQTVSKQGKVFKAFESLR